jgi:transposase InsO family protein
MSRQTSPGAARRYGLQRVCRVLAFPRSTIYAQRARTTVVSLHPKRRGPKPTVSDEALLEAIRADLATSPFLGEGHRKVWARRRIQCGIRVSRMRVLRLMRTHHLLSPHRSRPGVAQAHAGTILTDRPNELWGTDGIRIETVEDGWVWAFTAVDHFDACCVGHPVVKIGSRFAALEPIAMGLKTYLGNTCADAGRGLALRMDHGTPYTADHFLNQIRFWGITPSFAFVAEPETNGVAERFNRTLKEQAIYGRIFRNLQEVRGAVDAFVKRYNGHWRLEKLGFQTPLEARQAALRQEAA